MTLRMSKYSNIKILSLKIVKNKKFFIILKKINYFIFSFFMKTYTDICKIELFILDCDFNTIENDKIVYILANSKNINSN